MFRRHRHTIAYAALSSAIALAAVIVWIAATGRYQLPPGLMAAFAIGAFLISTGVEQAVGFVRARRRRPQRRAHARPRPVTPSRKTARKEPA